MKASTIIAVVGVLLGLLFVPPIVKELTGGLDTLDAVQQACSVPKEKRTEAQSKLCKPAGFVYPFVFF